MKEPDQFYLKHAIDREKSILADMFQSEDSKQRAADFLDRAMGLYKSAPVRQVLTVEQDKAQRLSRHAESNLQLKCCRWVGKYFPEDRIIVHKREGLRTGFNRAATLTLNRNSEHYPDHEFKCSTSLKIILIEFKRPGREWVTKNGRIKADCKDQYLMHLQLWKEGQIVYFCNDFDAFRELYKAFKDGKPLGQQIYEI